MSIESMTSAVRPTGRRRITPAMARARVLNDMAPMAEATRGQIIVAFKRGARALGMPKAAIEFVLYLASRTKACDWQEGGLPLAHPTNRDISVELSIGRSRIKAVQREAAELGLLVCVDSPTGRRFARRDPETGHITFGYGFDLSPLSRRYDEFRAAIAAQEEREREGERLRRHITVRSKAILSLVECARAEGVESPELARLAFEAQQLGRQRAECWDPSILGSIATRLDDLHDAAERQLVLVLPVETDPSGSGKVAPITSTNPSASAYASRDAEGRSAPATHERTGRPVGSSPTRNDAGCALRGFSAQPSLILRIAPAFRDLCTSSRPSQAEIVNAASMIAGSLGISPHAWGQACNVLGRYAAAVTVAVIATKRAAGQVASPGGYLRSMVKSHQAGKLHLDRTLFGLLDNLGLRGTA